MILILEIYELRMDRIGVSSVVVVLIYGLTQNINQEYDHEQKSDKDNEAYKQCELPDFLFVGCAGGSLF